MGEYSFNGVGTPPDADKNASLMLGANRKGTLQNSKPPVVALAERVVAVNLRAVRGSADIRTIVKVGGKVITVTGREATNDKTGANTAAGVLPNLNLVPGSITFHLSGAGNDIEDDGNGVLVDVGTSTVRGSINYETGAYSFTGSGAITNLTVDYQHTDYISVSDGAATPEVDTTGAGTVAQTHTTSFPIVPGTWSAADTGAQTYVDDGKGNVIQTNPAQHLKVGTIDYVNGVVTITASAAVIAVSLTHNYTKDKYNKKVAAGGGYVNNQFLPDGGEAYADAVKAVPTPALGGADIPAVKLGIFAESTSATDEGALRANFTYRAQDTFENASMQPKQDAVEEGGKSGISF